MVAGSDAGLSDGPARQASQQVLASLNAMLRQPLPDLDGGGSVAGGAAQQLAEKAALDDFLVMHARRYDFSGGGDAFDSTFALLVGERFLSAPNWHRMDTSDFRLRVLQCMRVLMRDGAHRRAFGRTPGAVARLCDLCVDLTTEHFDPPTGEGRRGADTGGGPVGEGRRGADTGGGPEAYTSEMLVETLSILKRFAHISAPAAAAQCLAAAATSTSTQASAQAPTETSALSRHPSASESPRGSPGSPRAVRRRQLFAGDDAPPPLAPPAVSPVEPHAGPPSVSPLEPHAIPLPSRHASPASGRIGRAAAPLLAASPKEGTVEEGASGAREEEDDGEGGLEPWRLHWAMVALLSTREALVLQCVLVAMYQFVQVRKREGERG
jgi:hypothetical protein